MVRSQVMMVARVRKCGSGRDGGRRSVYGPVETQFGWHVITLNDTRVQGSASDRNDVRAESGSSKLQQSETVEAKIARVDAKAARNHSSRRQRSDIDTSTLLSEPRSCLEP